MTEGDGRVVHGHAQHVVHAGDGGGDGVHHVGGQFRVREVDHLAALVGGHHAEEAVLVDVAAVHDDLAHGLSGRVALFLADRLHGVLVEDAVFDEEVEKRIECL